MTKMNEKLVSVKASPLGQDFQDALFERQRSGTLDIAQSIVALKEYLVKDLSPNDLKYLYPVYFDAARVLLAECVAEFFQTGSIHLVTLDPCRIKYAGYEIRQTTILPKDVSQLLRVLCRVQEPTHGLYLRHKADAGDWLRHIQAIHQTIRQLQ